MAGATCAWMRSSLARRLCAQSEAVGKCAEDSDASVVGAGLCDLHPGPCSHLAHEFPNRAGLHELLPVHD